MSPACCHSLSWSSVIFAVASQSPPGTGWPTYEIGPVLLPSMSPLVTGRLSEPLLVAGSSPGAPRTTVQRPRSSGPSNSSDCPLAQLGGGSDGGSSGGGISGSVSIAQSENCPVAFVPAMCDTTNRPMSCTVAADGIVVVWPTSVQSVPFFEHETMNSVPYFSTFSHVGVSSPGQAYATGSPLSLTWPLPPASCMYSVRPSPIWPTTRKPGELPDWVMSLRTMIPAFEFECVPSNDATLTVATKFSGAPPGRYTAPYWFVPCHTSEPAALTVKLSPIASNDASTFANVSHGGRERHGRTVNCTRRERPV